MPANGAVPWLLFIHPATRVTLLQAAPDFCDFAVLWLRSEQHSDDVVASTSISTHDNLSQATSHNDDILQRAQVALNASKFIEVRDLLTEFDLHPPSGRPRRATAKPLAC